MARIRRARPRLGSVVVKHDNSGAGDGNVVVAVRDGSGHRIGRSELVGALEASLPQWYLTDLGAGAVVEELMSGRDVRSPSAQVDVLPDGTVAGAVDPRADPGGRQRPGLLGLSVPGRSGVCRAAGRVRRGSGSVARRPRRPRAPGRRLPRGTATGRLGRSGPGDQPAQGRHDAPVRGASSSGAGWLRRRDRTVRAGRRKWHPVLPLLRWPDGPVVDHPHSPAGHRRGGRVPASSSTRTAAPASSCTCSAACVSTDGSGSRPSRPTPARSSGSMRATERVVSSLVTA